MDNFPDVNWSELTRKSIQNYIKNRQDPFPPLDFELSEVHLAYSNAVMQPLLNLSLKVNNKWNLSL